MTGQTRGIAGLLLGALAAAWSHGCAPSDPAASERRERADRILAVAPSVAEVLFELGLGERVVGVGDYVTWPPEAAAKPRIGGLFDPRLEDIVALEPDLAVVLPSEDRLANELERLGIEVLRVEHETLADLESAIAAIARRTGVEPRGRELIERLRSSLDTAPSGGPARRGLRTVLVVAREPGRGAAMTVVGSKTFLAELLDRSGARNVFADLGQSYAEVGLEEVLRRQPEAIIELQPEEVSDVVRSRLIADWQQLESMRERGRACVDVIAGAHVLVPGPRLTRLAEELGAVLAQCRGTGAAG